MKNICFLFLSLICYTTVRAQDQFPKNDFISPLKIPIQLAGSFAECRPNHFHTGIDLKTNNKENLPVLAAADGFISRISISHAGYGNCIYMEHPNGYTTVYGHLNNFMPEVMAYVKAEQYRQQKWNVDLKGLSSTQFQYQQGAQIAYSGNTGGSTAPHLHFEIRDTKTEAVYNALFFGLPVKDNIAPKATKLAVYNAESFFGQTPLLLKLQQSAPGKYTAGKTTFLSYKKIMLGTDAKDFTNGSTNWLGITGLQLYADEQLISEVQITQLNFAQNRAVNAYADFRTYQMKGIWLHGLYRLPNNPLEVYQNMVDNGVLDISDGRIHQIRIIMKDALGNTASISHSVQYRAATPTTACKGIFKAGQRNIYKHFTGNVYLMLPENVLYDDVCFNIRESLQPTKLSNFFEILKPEIPAHDYFVLGIKLHKTLPPNLYEKLVFIHKIPKAALPGSNDQEAQAAHWDSGYAVAKVRSFGNYSVAIDTTAPKIIRINPQSKSLIQFTVTDNLTFVTGLKGFINDQWVCFSRKGNTYTYVPDEHCPTGSQTLKLIAEDENKNQSVYRATFTR
ncbi:hypothetical protein DBR32_04615 [Taibaiella sp. KBW10]|uniref:M23 family metallopeptidase n=1 Tax=Taibaiella sp. KBW10 TaxID=2153357 RepID=UPI000F5938D2|nr:M23 family metallopeptidase [Taibaiella sp. KBW10]RQO31256.1 hypothetical protein DBR32_04615 [Taibaiella sp. KBW10]